MINTVIQGDCLEALRQMPDNSVDAIVTDPPYGLSFMGKKWDYDVPSVEIWQECLRVLKHGGHLLAFAGTRTQHRMAVRIEDAGFEIRDMIAWVYGSGFPKSLNVGKAVDKLQGNEREVVGINKNGGMSIENGMTFRDDNWKPETRDLPITKGKSPYEGWGTALKPALEPITVARKPLDGKTVANNVLKWGVGGLNIDGCRVGTEDKISIHGSKVKSNVFSQVKPCEQFQTDGQKLGRFPANLIHDGSDEVLGLFPNESQRFFYCAKASKSERNRGCEDLPLGEPPASARSKPAEGRQNALGEPRHNNHPTVKPIALMEYLIKLISRENQIVLDPFAGSGTTGIACINTGRNYILIEKEPKYIEIINKRIDGHKTQLKAI